MPTWSFVLDGAPVEVDADARSSALDVLRDSLGIFTAKAGCAPQGLCGCCTALVDGKARLTCTLPVRSLVGKSVVTVGGVPEPARARLAAAFLATGAAQCGYCTPGIVLSAHALIEGGEPVDDAAIDRALNLHTCRCTGYVAIRAAVRLAAGHEDLPASARPEGDAIVLGARAYVDDLHAPGGVVGAVVLAARSGIARLGDMPPGVVPLVADGARVVTGQPLVGAVGVGFAEAHAAMTGFVQTIDEVVDPPRTIAQARRRDAAPVPGARVAVAEVRVDPSDPAYLEPEAAFAVPTAVGGLTVYSPGHDAAGLAKRLTEALAVDVRVRLVPSGGSYGARAAPGLEEAAARLAVASGRAVRVSLDHEVAVACHRHRPGGSARIEAAIEAGVLRGVDGVVTIDGGVDAWDADAMVVRALEAVPYPAALTARVDVGSGWPTVAARGVGAVATIAAELAIDAAVGDGDRVAARRGALEGPAVAVFDAVVSAAAQEGACGFGVARAPGEGGARVILRVTGADEVEVSCNVPDLGQGRDEVLARALGQESGLDPSSFTFVWGESATVGAGAAPGAPVSGAARAAAAGLREEAAGSLARVVGRTFAGEDLDRAADGLAAAVVRLDGEGHVVEVVVAAAVGSDQDPRLAANLIEGAAQLGLGIALTERLDATPEGTIDARFRVLGLMKARQTPPIRALAVVVDGGPRDVAEAVALAVPAAVATALRAHEGVARARFPARDASAGRACGAPRARP